jgi:hypothetical protein
MLITQGNVRGFEKLPWAQVELASDSRLEEIMLHMIRWIKKRDDAFRILFPVATRDLGGVEMFYPNILIQCRDLRRLREIKVMGVHGVTMQSETVPLTIDAAYGESLIREAERVSSEWSRDVKRGCFVRILLGERRMLCGTVVSTDRGVAEVKVSLTVRDLRVRIPVRALLKLDIVKEKRKYYVGREETIR